MTVVFRKNGNFDRHMNALSGGAGVGSHLRKQAKEVERLAKIFVGTDSGLLKRSIKAGFPRKHALGLIVDVSANTKYAVYHHQGTRPHKITPKKASVLVFTGTRPQVVVDSRTGQKRLSRSRKVFALSVDHPGTGPNKYLSRALRVALVRNGGMSVGRP